jgi:hypothetical protein
LSYQQQFGESKEVVYQYGQIGLNGDYAFYVPYTVNYDSFGAYLVIEAIGGVRVLSQRILSSPVCFHIWVAI